MPTENRDRRTATATTRIALSGMMAALIFVATYFVKLPMAMTNGYVHLGDGLFFWPRPCWAGPQYPQPR